MRVTLILAALLSCIQQSASSSFSISASSAGGNGGPDWWFVDLKPDGVVEVTPLATVQKVTLKPAEMASLEAFVREQRLFDLKDSYGTSCSDCSVCTVKVTVGGRRKTISVGDLSRSSNQDKAEAARVLKLFKRVKEAAGISSREDAC